VNTAPTWLVNPLPGAAGLPGDLVETTIHPQYSQDLDQDAGTFSLSQIINNLNQTTLSLLTLPRLIPQALGQISLQWQIPPDTSVGAYNFLINRMDRFGATGTTLWTVSVTATSVITLSANTAYSAATFGLGITAIGLVFIAAVAACYCYKKRKSATIAIAARNNQDAHHPNTRTITLDGPTTPEIMPHITSSQTPPAHLIPLPPPPLLSTYRHPNNPDNPANLVLPPLLPSTPTSRGTGNSGTENNATSPAHRVLQAQRRSTHRRGQPHARQPHTNQPRSSSTAEDLAHLLQTHSASAIPASATAAETGDEHEVRTTHSDDADQSIPMPLSTHSSPGNLPRSLTAPAPTTGVAPGTADLFRTRASARSDQTSDQTGEEATLSIV